MKTRITITLAAVAAVAILTLSLVPDVEAGDRRRWRSWGQDANIVERLERMGQFDILLTALETAGLKETVETAESLTLFAPTDASFVALLEELGISATDLLASPDLANILLYHAVPGNRRAGSLVYESAVQTLLPDAQVLVRFQDFAVYVNEARVMRANVKASNGTIHVLGGVLLPPEDGPVENIVDVLELDGRFGILLAALEQEGLTGALEGVSSELTLFAPTDAAFEQLLATLGITAAELLANPDLGNILLYHVVPGNRRALDLLLNGGAETLLPGEYVSVEFRFPSVYVNDARVLNPNLSAPNGVIHVIEAVLLP
jgi:uncharacterized surface protein with fasciclin (FAS1) repeats